MKDFLSRISSEIKRLEEEDIQPAKHNAEKHCDKRISQMAQRFETYEKTLEDAKDNNNIEIITNYAKNIFNNIDWVSDDIESTDNRIDTLKILVYILNLLTSNSNKNKYLEIEYSKENFQKIINIISTKED